MIGPRATVVVVVFALLFSAYSLKHCLVSLPVSGTSGREREGGSSFVLV
jgi:hypothetical protein